MDEQTGLRLDALLNERCWPLRRSRKVFMAPFDVALADDTVMQPDLLVVRRVDTTSRGLRTAPVLAVEVLSPSTRRFDLLLKPSRLAVAGCPSYWVVDPAVPRLIAWQLQGTDYHQVADVSGEDTFRAIEPYEAQLTPEDLVIDHRRT